MSMAGCTAMDVISILEKKKQAVTHFEVKVHAERTEDYPKVYTRAEIEYQVTGRAVDEASVLRAIELSIQKYCPVRAMLSQAFPITQRYVIFEEEGNGARRAVRHARKQMRITLGVAGMQRDEIGDERQAATDMARIAVGFPDRVGIHASLRNTSVPLVPPKPKELEMATSIFIWRAVFGT